MTRPPLGRLLDQTFAFYRTHLALVLTIGLGVTATVDVILAIGLGELTARYSAKPPERDAVIAFVGSLCVTSPLITAMIACAVRESRTGRPPSLRESVLGGLDVFAPVLLVTVIYAIVVAVGLIAFVVPGVFIAVVWYFAPLAVVLDGDRGPRALTRSATVVHGGWFHAALTGAFFGLLVAVIVNLLGYATDALAKAADAQAIVVLANLVSETFTLPFVAIGATLYYLALREMPREQ